MAGNDWRSAPPPAGPATTYPAPYPAVAPRRDVAYAIGAPLRTVVRGIARIPFGALLLIAGWGISLPALILTRSSWHQGVRIALAAVVFAGWVSVIVAELMAMSS